MGKTRMTVEGRKYWVLTRFFFLAWYFYDEQHSNVCRNQGYICWSVIAQETSLSKSFKVVRYFPQKRESWKCKLGKNSAAKYPRNIKTQKGCQSFFSRNNWHQIILCKGEGNCLSAERRWKGWAVAWLGTDPWSNSIPCSQHTVTTKRGGQPIGVI